jgi:hypothetical protein
LKFSSGLGDEKITGSSFSHQRVPARGTSQSLGH